MRTKRKPTPRRPSKKANIAARRELRKLPSTWLRDGELTNRQLQDIVAERGLRLVPKDETTSIELLERRLDRFERDSRDAFAAAKDSHKALTALGAQMLPILTDLRAELGAHQGRIYSLEQDRGAHAGRLDGHDVKFTEHDGRLSAIEQHVFSKKGPQP